MSAFCVGYTHIDTLLTAGLTLTTHGPLTWLAAPTPSGDTERVNDQHLRRELRIETANTVGQMLINENARSVNHLYGGEQPELAQRYTYRRLLGPVQPVAVLKAVDCYEYQSCETPDWAASEARQFCEALRARCVHALPGYDAAPAWPVEDRALFVLPY